MKKITAGLLAFAVSIVILPGESGISATSWGSIFQNPIYYPPSDRFDKKKPVSVIADKTVGVATKTPPVYATTHHSDLRSLLGSKAYFYVKEGDDYLHRIEFNADVTSVTWTVIIAGDKSKKNGKQTLKINGDKLMIGEKGAYITLAKATRDYLLFTSAGEGEIPGNERFYFNEAKARTYLATP